MGFIAFLILFPLIAAVALFVIRSESARDAVVWVAGAATAVASVAFAVYALGTPAITIGFSSIAVDYVCMGVSIVIAVVIVAYAVKYRNLLAFALAIVQVAASLYFEIAIAHHIEVERGLTYDSLTVLMVLIIGVIGSGICVYALGYMKDYQAHEPEGAPDRRPTFFALMFLFLSAMYVIVFSNNMLWLFTGWEITTVCSFLLIGYTKTDEAIRNSFRQINMNLVGGIAFIAALYAIAGSLGTLAFDEFLELGSYLTAYAALPVTLLAVAGITKAAQMPFQSWLLGAMVAPTPTSALLHSSTMVKAGVFLLVKLAPLFMAGGMNQIMVVLVGGITFLVCSCLAISQSNAKRVLAYSTIANLGLITACAGVGTPEAVWAAMFLIMFHAIAKSLLFLCVGTAEHHIGSRDIESMDLLFDRMPRLARLMMLGIMCMFIAPFGMLVSKWATIASFAEANQFVLLVILAFGSAATFMFWAKWLGKLAGIAGSPENVEGTVHSSEWAATGLMAALLIVACVTMPFVSAGIVEPYLADAYGGYYEPVGLTLDNLVICGVSTVVVVAVLFFGLGTSKPARRANVYLAGVSVDSDARTYRNSLSQPQAATARNWYMSDMFSESRLGFGATAFAAAIIMFAIAYWAISIGSLFAL